MTVTKSDSLIHPAAVISPRAELASDVEVGPYVVIADDVMVESGTKIYAHACLEAGARIGKNCRIHQGAVIAGQPQDLKFSGEKTLAYIGENTVIREYVTVSRGTKHRGETRIGENCFLMAYAHVAHDCIIGNNVILANAVNLAGHVGIEDYAIVGGVVPVHQFVRIGCHSIIGGGFRVQMDVCPYMLAAGYPLKIYGLNMVGLKRRGFSELTIRLLEKAYKIIFRSKLNTKEALARVQSELEPIPEIQKLVSFIQRSERGIIK